MKKSLGHRMWAHPEVDSVPDSIGKCRVNGFIKLEEDLKSQLGGDLLSLKTHTHTQSSDQKGSVSACPRAKLASHYSLGA